MTENKRFIHVYGEMGAFRMQDTVTGEYISIANDYNDNDITVADKLESLADENEQLKYEIVQLKNELAYKDRHNNKQHQSLEDWARGGF